MNDYKVLVHFPVTLIKVFRKNRYLRGRSIISYFSRWQQHFWRNRSSGNLHLRFTFTGMVEEGIFSGMAFIKNRICSSQLWPKINRL